MIRPVAVAALVAAAAATAAADPHERPESIVATSWLRIGLERYQRGNFVGAIQAFERGYAEEPRPEFLFALGQAHRRRGDCARAADAFTRFLATAPSQAQADAARDQRDRCTPPPREPSPPPPVAAPAPPEPVVRAPAAPRRDRVALVAGATGVALAATGATLLVLAHRDAGAAAAATTYDAHVRLADRAVIEERAGAAVLAAAAAAGAVVAWRLWRADARPRSIGVAVAPAARGGAAVALTVGGRF